MEGGALVKFIVLAVIHPHDGCRDLLHGEKKSIVEWFPAGWQKCWTMDERIQLWDQLFFCCDHYWLCGLYWLECGPFSGLVRHRQRVDRESAGMAVASQAYSTHWRTVAGGHHARFFREAL